VARDAGIWVLDRIEDAKLCVLLSDSGEERTVTLAELPPGVREGDALRELEEETGIRYRVDQEATERLRHEAADLRSSLRRGPSGDVSL
jgi:hypothetical protein